MWLKKLTLANKVRKHVFHLKESQSLSVGVGHQHYKPETQFRLLCSEQWSFEKINITAAVGLHLRLWFRGLGVVICLDCLPSSQHHQVSIKLPFRLCSCSSTIQGGAIWFLQVDCLYKDNHLCSTNAFSLDWCMRQQKQFKYMQLYTHGDWLCF